jgi:intraflagellar transport protein 172
MRGSNSQIDAAVKVLHARPGPVTEAALNTYKRLVRTILARPKQEENAEHFTTVGLLREVMYRLANQYRAVASDKQLHPDVVELLMATHYQHMLHSAKAFGLRDVAVKCATTLLKYPYVVPQDKAFHQAGMLSKEMGNTNLAFMLLNRYVDLTEAIESNDPSFLDNSEFQDTDAVPLNGPLPTSQYLRDEVSCILI